jgi:hypothetical protein
MRTWPVFVPLVPTAASVFGISDWHAYDLARRGGFYVEVLSLGKRLMCRTTDLLRAAGLDAQVPS